MGGSDNDISDEDDLMDSLDDDSDVLDDLSVNDENSQDNSADNKVKLKVLYGSMTDVPKEQKNIIRLFISSTFTDMTEERNMLMSSVFPKLKNYCQQTYKQEFQVVDMRWGVQDQAADDHSTSDICLREILNCREESAGPYFVLLVGDRYGTRFLKKSIAESDWSVLYNRVRSSDVKTLLDTWYKLDSNSETPSRILQPISSVENGNVTWAECSVLMYDSIRMAAIDARNDGELSAQICQQYIRSVTEDEVSYAGLLDDELHSSTKSRSLVFMRSLENINTSHQRAGRYIDLKPDTVDVDTEAQDLLVSLKSRLSEAMPAENIKQYSVPWCESGRINYDDHADYLKLLEQDFYNQAKKIIDTCTANESTASKAVHDDDLTREILSHTKQGVDKLSKVVPRNDILDKIKAYITGQSDAPLVVHGYSGCGKTSVMASVAQQCSEWLKGDETAVVLRFLGTTPSSSDIEKLLISIISQIHLVNQKKHSIDGDDEDFKNLNQRSLKELITKFKDVIKQAKGVKKQKLVIILDSVDQLRSNDQAFNLSWLPTTLSPNVKFIISTLPDIHGIFNSAKSLDIPDDNYVEVQTLNENSAWAIIEKWLTMKGRKLTEGQRKAITANFKDRSLPPLYIKLVFDVIVKWKSYTENLHIPEDVLKCLEELYNDLEAEHGELQVKLMLGYFSCCPAGISQAELEDVLSIDDEYLTVVYQYHIPPVRRIPPSLWVRIKNSISDYVVEKESDGVASMFWYHRQFIEYATKRYVTGQEYEKHCFVTLSDYFTGKWRDEPKEFSYTDKQLSKLSEEERKNVVNGKGNALRYVAPQHTRSSPHTFNARKINVLGQIWTQKIMSGQSFINSGKYLFDIEFLTGKFIHDIWSNISRELDTLSQFMASGQLEQPSPFQIEYEYVRATLTMYSGLFSMGPLSLSSNLLSALSDKYNICEPVPPSDGAPPNLAWFLSSLLKKDLGASISPLVPVTKRLDSPGGTKIISRQTDGVSKLFQFDYRGMRMMGCFSEDGVILHTEKDGAIVEFATIATSNQYDNCEFMEFGAESYLFCWGCGIFALISLDNEREVFSENNATVDPDNEDAVFSSEQLCIFTSPHSKGKDSIMFSAYENNLVVIYSMKLKKIVWHLFVPDCEDDDGNQIRDKVEIYYSCMNPTDETDKKHLEIIFNRKTEVYTVVLLEDGSVDVSLSKTIENGWIEDVESRVRKVVWSSHGEKQMDILLCPDQPVANKVMITSKNVEPGSQIHNWMAFDIQLEKGEAERIDIYPAGKLKSGVDLLVLNKRTGKTKDKNVMRVLEFYLCKDHQTIEYSTCMHFHDDIAQIQLIPKSDVLVITSGKNASLYYLETAEYPVITNIHQACIMPVDKEEPIDSLADEYGYFRVNSNDHSTTIFDISRISKYDMSETSPFQKTIESTMQILTLPPGDNGNFFISLQGSGYVWDAVTNDHMLTLPGNKEDGDQSEVAQYYPGDDQWEYFIAIHFGEKTDFVALNTKTFDADFRCKVKMKSSAEAITPDAGVLAIVDDQGSAYLMKRDSFGQNVVTPQTGLLLLEHGDNKHAVWKQIGFSMMDVIYLDSHFLLTGDICDPKDDDAELEYVSVLYDATNFKLVKIFKEIQFAYLTYYRKYGVAVGVDTNLGLMWFDMKTLDLKEVKPGGDTTAKYTMLDSYHKDENIHQYGDCPYFYILKNTEPCELLRLDVTKIASWEKGEGIQVVGKMMEDFFECRISTDNRYIAGSVSSASINLYRIINNENECGVVKLGSYSFQGTVDKFTFTQDSRYIVAVEMSGSVISLKILDPTESDATFISETDRLPYTKNHNAAEQVDLERSPQWTMMKDVCLSNDRSKSTTNRAETHLIQFLVQSWIPYYGVKVTTAHGSSERKSVLHNEPVDSEMLIKGTNPLSAQMKKPHPPAEPKPAAVDQLLQGSHIRKQSHQDINHGEGEVKTKSMVNTEIPVPPSISPMLKTKLGRRPDYQRLSEIRTDRRLIDHAKAYVEMPNDQKEKALDALVNDVKKGNSVMCAIL